MRTNFFFRHTEGMIVLSALILCTVLVVALIGAALFDPGSFRTLLNITLSNIVIGRMAGLAIGISAQLDPYFLIAYNFYLEMLMVLFTYPLFVLSWKKLHVVSYAPLVRYLERSREAAQKYRPTIQKYGMAGLIFFVLTPLVMTGPVVGAFVGHLMGFGHFRTLTTVLSSTFVAILLWTYLISNFEATLMLYSDMLNIAAAGIIVILLVWQFLRK